VATSKAAEVIQVRAPSKTPLILALVNSLAALAAIGLLAYTKLVFKRPAITESSERHRLSEQHAAPRVPLVPAQIAFESTTVNIATTPENARPDDGSNSQIQGKQHFATVAFTLEIADARRKDEVEALRPRIMDRFLQSLGRKQFHELTTVQGRYVLRTELVNAVNELAVSAGERKPGSAAPEPLAKALYFTQFIVQ
jgi:flagellar basal body-associated protein FliL